MNRTTLIIAAVTFVLIVIAAAVSLKNDSADDLEACQAEIAAIDAAAYSLQVDLGVLVVKYGGLDELTDAERDAVADLEADLIAMRQHVAGLDCA